jgi:hypothetical protein
MDQQVVIPPSIAHIAEQFVQQGCTILLAFIGDNCNLPITGDKRATIVFEVTGKKILWTMAGTIIEGRFETSIGGQHPISEDHWKKLLAEHTNSVSPRTAG